MGQDDCQTASGRPVMCMFMCLWVFVNLQVDVHVRYIMHPNVHVKVYTLTGIMCMFMCMWVFVNLQVVVHVQCIVHPKVHVKVYTDGSRSSTRSACYF